MPLTFVPARVDAAPGSTLVADMSSELETLYGVPLSSPGMPTATAAELAPPGGGFVVGVDGVPVCCGGFKAFGEGVAEIKRMYVVPERRHGGVAGRLLVHLLWRIVDLGYERVLLDTGDQQHFAQQLYEHEGFVPVPAYVDHPVATWFGELSLADWTARNARPHDDRPDPHRPV